LCRCVGAHAADDSETRLLREPTVSRDHLAFVYAGDIWVSDRDGQHPARITTDPASEFAPHFSPDGKWIAFSASYGNNTDVYVVPVEGGQPRRLTWHPAPDIVTGWTPDSKQVVFASNREVANSKSSQLYEVPLVGGYEKKIMNAVAVEGSWSPDGKRFAYRPNIMAYSGAAGWRQHRGGETPPIWIIDRTARTLEKIPHVNASDSNPMWIGNDVAFISDRNEGAKNLFLYNVHTREARQLTHETQWDVREADAYDRTIVYETGGELKSIDLDNDQIRPIPVHLISQAIQARPQWKDASKNITSARLSPTGKRVLITARGDVFSVPVKDGSVRNLTATSGVRESDALWSFDGQRVAYLSDEGGTQTLLVRDAVGLEKPVRHALGDMGYLDLLDWSPDDRRIVFQDSHLHLYSIDLDKGTVSLIDTNKRRDSFSTPTFSPDNPFKPVFSPDGQWIAYTIVAKNYFTQVRLYSFATGHSTNLANDFIQTDNPIFGGSELLYFTASINAGPSRDSFDMSSQEAPLRKAIYAAVLSADGRSPLPPKNGDEEPTANTAKKIENKDNIDKKGQGDQTDKARESIQPTRIDFEGLSQRFVPIPIAERDYDSLLVGSDGALFYLSRKQPGSSVEPPGADADANADLYRYSFEDRAEKLLQSGLFDISTSADRKKLLLTSNQSKLEVAEASEKLEPKPIDVGGLTMLVDPREEWRQIFDETWRTEQQNFYDPNMHGLDWHAVRARYEPLLHFVQRREDLNELLVEMIGEMQVGHNRVSGGDVHTEAPTAVGLLGADFTVDHNLYRIQKIYRGDRWNPFLVAPLAAAGVNVTEGDAILAINGHALDGSRNIFSLLEGTADKQTSLTVSRGGAPQAARTITVTPIANEAALRQWEWIERNREYVERKSAGRVAYVYLPDTYYLGYTFFNRMFFAQIDKDALIVDDRRNGGGQTSRYVLEVLNRQYLSGWKTRDGLGLSTPAAAIYGPKVMLIDQDAGSGGDFFPYGFRRLGLGKLIGTRTWGGLIGYYANNKLIDGGILVVPSNRIYTPDGTWEVENEGVAPDINVELDPLAVNDGVDTQLDAAVSHVLDQLKTSKPVVPRAAPPVPTQVGH
jgi:tricorn protease